MHLSPGLKRGPFTHNVKIIWVYCVVLYVFDLDTESTRNVHMMNLTITVKKLK